MSVASLCVLPPATVVIAPGADRLAGAATAAPKRFSISWALSVCFNNNNGLVKLPPPFLPTLATYWQQGFTARSAWAAARSVCAACRVGSNLMGTRGRGTPPAGSPMQPHWTTNRGGQLQPMGNADRAGAFRIPSNRAQAATGAIFELGRYRVDDFPDTPGACEDHCPMLSARLAGPRPGRGELKRCLRHWRTGHRQGFLTR